MEYNKLQKIQLSLLKKRSEIDPSTNKAQYDSKVSAKFHFPDHFFDENPEEKLESLLEHMYEDINKNLLKNDSNDSDYLGIWILYDNITIDNAIALQTLKDIEEYAKRPISSVYEFFKMTNPEQHPEQYKDDQNI